MNDVQKAKFVIDYLYKVRNERYNGTQKTIRQICIEILDVFNQLSIVYHSSRKRHQTIYTSMPNIASLLSITDKFNIECHNTIVGFCCTIYDLFNSDVQTIYSKLYLRKILYFNYLVYNYYDKYSNEKNSVKDNDSDIVNDMYKKIFEYTQQKHPELFTEETTVGHCMMLCNNHRVSLDYVQNMNVVKRNRVIDANFPMICYEFLYNENIIQYTDNPILNECLEKLEHILTIINE